MTKKNLLKVAIVGVLIIALFVFWKEYQHSISHEESGIRHENTGTQNESDGETHAMHTVTYTSSGFREDEIAIKSGDMVTFSNESEDLLRVAFGEHEDHDVAPDAEHHPDIKAGTSDTVTFTTKGTFEYHNHHDEEHTGVIIVE